MKRAIDTFLARIGIHKFKPQGTEGIQKLGHRKYVGGRWDEIGQLQFDFLVQQGLQPDDYLLDIACGSLRAGVHLIPYLETGRYLGIEKEEELIALGIEKELGPQLTEEKQPQFVVSSAFEFEKFSARPDYSIAQSLFTHLPAEMIVDCFAKLRKVINEDGAFYATFFESQKGRQPSSQSHDHDYFAYTRQQMEAFGTETGWAAEYIGDWGHPRDQKVVKYQPRT